MCHTILLTFVGYKFATRWKITQKWRDTKIFVVCPVCNQFCVYSITDFPTAITNGNTYIIETQDAYRSDIL